MTPYVQCPVSPHCSLSRAQARQESWVRLGQAWTTCHPAFYLLKSSRVGIWGISSSHSLGSLSSFPACTLSVTNSQCAHQRTPDWPLRCIFQQMLFEFCLRPIYLSLFYQRKSVTMPSLFKVWDFHPVR